MSIIADVYHFIKKSSNIECDFKELTKLLNEENKLDDYSNIHLSKDKEVIKIILDVLSYKTSSKIIICGDEAYNFLMNYSSYEAINNNPNIYKKDRFKNLSGLDLEDNKIIIIDRNFQ